METTSAPATRPRRLRRALTLAAGAVGVAFLLSGCLKLDMALTLTPENTVDGTIVFAIDKQLLTLGGGNPEDAFKDSASDAPFPTSPSSGSVTTEVYDQDGKYGQKFIFSGVPLSEFDDEDMKITREGDYFVVNGTLDMSDSSSTSGDEEAPLPLPSSLTAGFDVQVSMTFPGEVVEHNGTLEGTTVTWKPTTGENLVMKAKAKATAESAGVLGLSSSSSSTPLLLGLGAAALLLVAGLVVLLVRRGRTPAAAGAAGAAMTGVGVADPSAVPGFAPVVPGTSTPDPAWAPPATFQPEPVVPEATAAAHDTLVVPEATAPAAPPAHDTLVVPEATAPTTFEPPASPAPLVADSAPEPPAPAPGDQPGTLPPPV